MRTRCVLAYWHHARFSSGHDGNNTFVQPFWNELYERAPTSSSTATPTTTSGSLPMDATAGWTRREGMREFVVGTGGAFFTSLSSARPNSVVRQNHTYGVLRLALRASSYDWQFVPEAGGTFTDSGSVFWPQLRWTSAPRHTAPGGAGKPNRHGRGPRPGEPPPGAPRPTTSA